MYNLAKLKPNILRRLVAEYDLVSSKCFSTTLCKRADSIHAVQMQYGKNLRDSVSLNEKDDDMELPPKIESDSFAANLFRGIVAPDEVFPYPEPVETAKRQEIKEFTDDLNDFFRDVNNADKNDKKEVISAEAIEGLKELGLMGLRSSQDYGGLGLNNTYCARINECVGIYDLSIAAYISFHQLAGYKGIEAFGTDEQKEKYLPMLACGEWIGAFAMSEPESGCDPSTIQTKAYLEDESGEYYILNGNKIWITNGGLADVFTVIAKTPHTDDFTGEKVDEMTAFIVERSFGGVTNGPPESKMGIRACNTAEVHFDQVRIPAENVLGEVGEGFKVAMHVVNSGRFSMGAALSGTMRHAISECAQYVNHRKQFGLTLNQMGGIQEKLARMALLHYVSESMTYLIASNCDKGHSDQIESAICKIFCSEAASIVLDEAIQIHGGLGYMRETGLERIMRDTRSFRIIEGSNDILRIFLALTGFRFASSHLGDLLKAMHHPMWNMPFIVQEGTKRILKISGIVGTDRMLLPYVDDQLINEGQMASIGIAEMGRTVELLLAKYEKALVTRQFHITRVANAAIELYSMVVVLSRVTSSIQHNLPTAEHEIAMARVWCESAYGRAMRSLAATRVSKSHFLFKDLSFIAHNICKEGGVVQIGPLGI